MKGFIHFVYIVVIIICIILTILFYVAIANSNLPLW